MDIKELLKDIELDPAAMTKIEKAISKYVGDEYVKKQLYKDKLAEIETLKVNLQTAEDGLVTAETYKQKYDDEVAAHGETKKTMQTNYDNYKSSVETEKLTAAKKTALRSHLESAGGDKRLIGLLEKEFDLAKIDLEGDAIKDWDNLFAPVKEQYSDIFTVEDVKGFKPANSSPKTGNVDYIAKLEAARKAGNTQEAVRIKTEAAKEGVYLI